MFVINEWGFSVPASQTIAGLDRVLKTRGVTDQATSELIDRFIATVRPVVPLAAMWAHGSLAAGDYQPGRSDLDLVAVLDRPCTAVEEQRLAEVHARLDSTIALAGQLHCSYCAVAQLGDPAQTHLTWAHREVMRRTVTPVTRRELHEFGLVLYGRGPAGMLPPVSDAQLAAFITEDLKSFWRPALEHRPRWDRDIWVDLGLLTMARATVTLRDGRLITKAEALDVLTALRAPAQVVQDIRERRYGAGEPGPAAPEWIDRRAQLTMDFLRPAIEGILADRQPGDG